ncbi:MAG TPA: DUF2934 domain-containing protein [Candidatus Acidoferrum sp.]|nr:DUF2934 domain-containing protein [Candidatus Acidoferrum sp.]
MMTSAVLQNQEIHKETVHIGRRKDFGKRICELNESISRRAYEIFERKGKTHGHDIEDWFEAQAELLSPLHGDFVEEEFSLKWRAEIDDFHAKDLEVHVEPHRLVVLGRKVADKFHGHPASAIHESQGKEIYRVVDLPMEVDPFMVTANIQNGMLEVFMLKAANPRERMWRAAAA